MKPLRIEKLVMSDVDGNNNKFYQISIHPDFSVHVVNGRVGASGQNQAPKNFSNEAAANHFVDSKIREKNNKGYKAFQGIATTQTKGGSSRMALEMAASEQIRTKHQAIVSELIKRLVQSNIHSILKNTDLKYDEDTGVFQTPLGVVTIDSIKDARVLLDKLSTYIEASDFDGVEVKKLLAEYLMLIPQKVDRKLSVKGVLPDRDAIQKQNGILDDLEASIAQLDVLRKQKAADEQAGKTTKVEVEKIFNCEINVVDDSSVLDKIQKFFDATRKKMHASYGYKIKRVFEVQVDHMQEAFKQDGAKVGNIKMLWHGTRPGNVLSILKSGFVIPPSTASFVCGRMFGHGIYFSDESTKSLNYATGWWAGASENQCFMFLADVAMGIEHTPRGPSQNLPFPGTDSTYAVGGKSGVQNNEMIIYQTSRASIRYLVEFE